MIHARSSGMAVPACLQKRGKKGRRKRISEEKKNRDKWRQREPKVWSRAVESVILDHLQTFL